MAKTIGAFFSLYLATLILLLSSGMFNTYVGLRLTAQSVSEIWVGAMIASYYLGLVLGARFGHRLIIQVGHIRAYAACAALRLARFNSQVAVTDKRWFIGLASPAAAGLMAAFVWTCTDLGLSGEELRYFALAVTVCAGLLMVSRIRYSSFKGGSGPKSERVPFFALLIAVAILVALVLDPPKVLLAVGVLYALSGPVMWFRRRRGDAAA